MSLPTEVGESPTPPLEWGRAGDCFHQRCAAEVTQNHFHGWVRKGHAAERAGPALERPVQRPKPHRQSAQLGWGPGGIGSSFLLPSPPPFLCSLAINSGRAASPHTRTTTATNGWQLGATGRGGRAGSNAELTSEAQPPKGICLSPTAREEGVSSAGTGPWRLLGKPPHLTTLPKPRHGLHRRWV